MSDPNFNDVLYLQHYEVDAVADVVGIDWTLDQVGTGLAEYSTEQSRYGTGSLKTDGDGDLNYALIYQNPMTLDTSQAFTLECSLYVTSLAAVNGVFGQGSLSVNTDRFQLIVRTDGTLSLFAATGGVTYLQLETLIGDAISINTWYDIAVCYNGVDTVYLYLDGVLKDSGGTFNNYAPTNDFFRWAIARAGDALRTNTGYIDETRVTQVDRYSGSDYATGPFPDEASLPAGTVWLKTPTSDLEIALQKGFGGIQLLAQVALGNLGAAWVPLPADTATLVVPKDVTQDFANGAIILLDDGVWQVNVGITLSFTATGARRTISARLFNLTKGTAGPSTPVGIPSNTEVLNMSYTQLFDVASTEVGDLFIVQVGNGSTVNATIVENYTLSSVQIY